MAASVKCKYKRIFSVFNMVNVIAQVLSKIFFFYLGFLSRPFRNHRTAGEGGGHFFNSSLPLPSAS